MAGKSLIGQLAVDLYMETAAFEQGASQAEKRLTKMSKRFEAMGQSMVNLGSKLSIGVTAPLIAFGAIAVKAAAESKDAIGQVDAALKSMGDGAGRTSEQLEKLASGLMRNSLYDDDEILRKVTANLLTFGNVAGEQFDRAQQAAVDLAARMGTDLQAATIMIGKALNDPIKGLAALRRVGIQFTEQQQEQIKAMAEAGNVAGAQAVMLKELERQFGNSAKAAREADPMAAVRMSWAEFQETVGEKLLPLLPRLADALTKVLDAFGKLSPGMQQAVIIGAGVAAALGPVLIVVGSLVKVFAPLFAVMSAISAAGGPLLALQAGFAGFAAVLGPVALAIAAVAAAGYLIYQNWDKIAPVLQELWQTIQSTLGPPLQELIATVSGALNELWNGPLGPFIKAAAKNLLDLYVAFTRAMGPVILQAIKVLIGALSEMFRMIGEGIKFVNALFEGDWKTAISAAASYFNHMFGGLPGNIIATMGQIVTAIRDYLINRLGTVWNGVKEKIEAVKGWFRDLYQAVVGGSYIPDMVDGIAAQMLRLDAVMVKPAEKAAKKTVDTFKKLTEEVKPLLDRLFPEAAALNKYRAELKLIDRAEQAKATTPEQAAEARRRLFFEGHEATFADQLRGEDNPLPGLVNLQKELMKLVGTTWETADGVEVANVKIVKSFKDMAQDTLASLQNLGNSIKSGGFLDIFGAVVDLLLQLGSIGAFGKSLQTNINTARFGGARAMGGPVVSGKSYLVGEHGPEWFTPGAGGRITPMNDNGGSVVTVVPSPYFDAHVDGRAAKVAGPMAMASGHYARQAAQGDMRRRGRRRIPG